LLIDITDLKPDNIMVRLEDKSILERDARNENENPLPQKKYDDRTIYLSRNNYGQPTSVTGIVSITDFGLSVQGDVSNNGCIQAEVYRAPEVILEAGWTHSADIWNLGVMVVSLLFWYWRVIKSDVCHSYGIYWKTSPFSKRSILWNPSMTIKCILRISLHCWGPRHKISLRGEKGLQCFMILRVSPCSETGLNSILCLFTRETGKLKGPDLTPQNFSLENSTSKIDGEDKRMFLKFVSRMLTWQPEDRSTAKDLLSDPWLRAEFPRENK